MALRPTAMPVGTEPVKLTLDVPSWAISSRPALPPPLTTFSTPAGNPASLANSAMRSIVSGVNWLALMMLVQPVASAEANFQTAIMIEKFHGTMPTTTPTGSRRVKAL